MRAYLPTMLLRALPQIGRPSGCVARNGKVGSSGSARVSFEYRAFEVGVVDTAGSQHFRVLATAGFVDELASSKLVCNGPGCATTLVGMLPFH